MSQLPSRICVLSLRQAWPWRWEMALLEIGCCNGWRLPDTAELAKHANAIGLALRSQEAKAALAFEGYTLVGACWRPLGTGLVVQGDLPAFGPYVMPRQRQQGLDSRLLEAIAA
ncbi:hypothetical protein [Arenimonas oryziterrae]|uniref:N-acetyltransferase domain-containing protein n=1 Tax=Arenimonas oryziterrae DSM 21050 = YC6267 TaxID=1121015 RepID=A0A091AQ98_9GAMM|nr:hypothetical protein [Arenimonas oryziterrae]KFN41189.1 hypothetical protein N789_04700 [Arenimonas oryziterrae DSM 21050 = YC6267]